VFFARNKNRVKKSETVYFAALDRWRLLYSYSSSGSSGAGPPLRCPLEIVKCAIDFKFH
jgi:hypothetical protein